MEIRSRSWKDWKVRFFDFVISLHFVVFPLSIVIFLLCFVQMLTSFYFRDPQEETSSQSDLQHRKTQNCHAGLEEEQGGEEKAAFSCWREQTQSREEEGRTHRTDLTAIMPLLFVRATLCCGLRSVIVGDTFRALRSSIITWEKYLIKRFPYSGAMLMVILMFVVAEFNNPSILFFRALFPKDMGQCCEKNFSLSWGFNVQLSSSLPLTLILPVMVHDMWDQTKFQ